MDREVRLLKACSRTPTRSPACRREPAQDARLAAEGAQLHDQARRAPRHKNTNLRETRSRRPARAVRALRLQDLAARAGRRQPPPPAATAAVAPRKCPHGAHRRRAEGPRAEDRGGRPGRLRHRVRRRRADERAPRRHVVRVRRRAVYLPLAHDYPARPASIDRRRARNTEAMARARGLPQKART